MRTTIAILATLAFAFVSASTAEADSIHAYSGNIHVGSPQNGGANPNGKGRQTLSDFTLGLDFEVTDQHGIVITSLGIWDDNGDGLLSPHTLRIYDLDTEAVLASIDIPAGLGGTLVDGYRYFELPTGLELVMGDKFTMAVYYGVGNQDSNGNSNVPDREPRPDFDGGDGFLANNGLARYGFFGNIFPFEVDYGPENRYHAGSFEYHPNPEPGTMALLGGAALAGGYLRRRRRRKQQQNT